MSEKQRPICDQCGETLSSNSALYRHLRTKHDIEPETGRTASNGGGGDFQCHVCDKSFKQKWSVTRHLKDIHQVEVQVQEKCSGKPAAFQCDECPRCYVEKKDLNSHVKAAHSGPREKVECEVCHELLSCKSAVLRHMKNIHGIVMNNKDDDVEDSERFHCEYCDCSYKQKKHLYNHIRTKHSDVAEFDDSEVSPSELEAAKKKLPCPDCSQTFSCKFTLDRHMSKKHGVVKSQTLPTGECPMCNAHVDHGESVMVHLQEAHDFDMETQELHFNSIDEFNSWKNEMCSETLTQYAKVRGDVDVEGGVRMFLNCHRSGKKRSQGLRGSRRPKRLSQRLLNQNRIKRKKSEKNLILLENEAASIQDHMDVETDNQEKLVRLCEEVIALSGQLQDVEVLKHIIQDTEEVLKLVFHQINEQSGETAVPVLA